jgi:hypothetical protein
VLIATSALSQPTALRALDVRATACLAPVANPAAINLADQRSPLPAIKTPRPRQPRDTDSDQNIDQPCERGRRARAAVHERSWMLKQVPGDHVA